MPDAIALADGWLAAELSMMYLRQRQRRCRYASELSPLQLDYRRYAEGQPAIFSMITLQPMNTFH
jgi:hypothetical protein